MIVVPPLFFSRWKINHLCIVSTLLLCLWCTNKYVSIQTFIKIKMFAIDGRKTVPIAWPFLWRWLMLLKMKLFRVNIRKRNFVTTFYAIGLSIWAFGFSLITSILTWLENLVYKHSTSIDTNIVFPVSSYKSLTFLTKSVVSLTWDGMFCTCGCK